MRGFLFASLLAGFVAATPNPSAKPYKMTPVRTQAIISTIYSTPTAKAKPIKMYPIAHPDADLKDLKNLKVTKDASMRYAKSQDDVDQEVATISTSDP